MKPFLYIILPTDSLDNRLGKTKKVTHCPVINQLGPERDTHRTQEKLGHHIRPRVLENAHSSENQITPPIWLIAFYFISADPIKGGGVLEIRGGTFIPCGVGSQQSLQLQQPTSWKSPLEQDGWSVAKYAGAERTRLSN